MLCEGIDTEFEVVVLENNNMGARATWAKLTLHDMKEANHSPFWWPEAMEHF